MKHVFTIHSPITFLIAHAIIEDLNLALQDVVILTNNYQVPLDQYTVYPFYSNLNNGWYQKLVNMNTPTNEDKYIRRITGGDDYVAYIDLMSYNQAILVTNERCKAFHFIEEGNSSYRKGDTFDTLTWNWFYKEYPLRINSLKSWASNLYKSIRWSLRGYSHRLLAIPYSFTNYAFFEGVNFFSFSEQAFPDIDKDRKRVVKITNRSNSIAKLSGNVHLQDTYIWVDGSNSGFTKLSDKIYFDAVDSAIDKLQQDLREKGVSIKLRPGTIDFQNNYLYRRLSQIGINVTVLPDNVILECVFINSENCKVVGNLSSALFYASIFGHQAYSLYSLYKEKPRTIFDDMPGYWKMITKL